MTIDLTTFQALSFDCYGTLIDWEAGIAAVLTPWAKEQGLDATDGRPAACVRRPRGRGRARGPGRALPRGARRCLPTRPARPWAARSATSGPSGSAARSRTGRRSRTRRTRWPASANRYRLIILSNVHRDGFAGSNRRLRGDFAAIITAEDVGAYKPAENHFRALDRTLDELGVERSGLLHVAQSLFHDHVPAKREGLAVGVDQPPPRPRPAGAPPRSRAASGPTTWSSRRWAPSPTPSTQAFG